MKTEHFLHLKNFSPRNLLLNLIIKSDLSQLPLQDLGLVGLSFGFALNVYVYVYDYVYVVVYVYVYAKC